MKFDDVTVLVAGDVMLDHYITGKAARISPEAPVPVVSRQSSWMVPGGAANVARQLATLGCQTRLTGFAADDPPGVSLSQKVAAEGIQAIFAPGRNRPTICKTRIMANGQQLLRLDEETIAPPALPERVALSHALDKLFEGVSALILSDYAKGALLADASGFSLCEKAIRMCAAQAVPVLVDPKGVDWSRYAGADCVTPNTGEFLEICQATFGNTRPGPGEWPRLAHALMEKFNLGRILLTRGPDGMMLFERDKPPLKIPAAVREVADVSGAGDVVIATLAACAARGMPWEESAAIANAAAGVSVGKIGASPVSLAELSRALEPHKRQGHVYELEQLLQTVARWRREGRKIVFTNGCFDLLHPGHISLLRESAALGDRLIIGLNSDASVRRLKGPSRPIQNQESRAQVLAALADVDAVTLFEEDTPEKLIEAIAPDVLVKGGDYSLENVVGAKFVQSRGGQVHLARLVPGQSTSDIEKRMRENADTAS